MTSHRHVFGIVESNLCFLRAPDVVISEWTEFVNIKVVEKRHNNSEKKSSKMKEEERKN